MTATHYLTLGDGSTIDVTDRVDLIEGWSFTEKAEEGAVGSGSVWLNDPDMDLDVDGLRPYTVVESDSEATDNVIFGGITADPEVSRGEQGTTHYDPLARAWQVQLTDWNGYWNRRVMVGTDCKRGAETDVQRMQWLLTTTEAGWLDDASTYLATGSASAMDKNDYRGQYLNQIVDDGAQHTGKNWWVQRQETGSGRVNVGWYGLDGLTDYSSPLYLSNDPADWTDAELLDGTSLVWPYADDTKLKRDTSRVYSGIYLRYASGSKAIYRRNATTVTAYGYRDYVADYPNVKTKAKAIARATRLLADLANPDERIPTKVRLPKGKATMLRAGMRVQFKGTHLPGYTSYRWMRVLSVTVSPAGAGEFYDLAIELQGPGTEGTAGPYAGDVFAGLVRMDSYSGDPKFQNTQAAPPGGWDIQATTGPIAIDQVSTPFSTITVSAAMLVRCSLIAQFSQVAAGTQSITVNVTVNGSVIGSDSSSYSGGLGFWSDTLTVNVGSVLLAAGDTVGISYSATAGAGWTNFGTNQTHLRVGRGSFSFTSGDSFVGP